MQPKQIVRLYKLLCPICRYDWVYEGLVPNCTECANARFVKETHRTHMSYVKFHEDYHNEIFQLELTARDLEKGRALAIFTEELPYDKELFDTFVYRSDFIPGRFFTKKRFIGTSLPKHELLHTNVFFFAT